MICAACSISMEGGTVMMSLRMTISTVSLEMRYNASWRSRVESMEGSAAVRSSWRT